MKYRFICNAILAREEIQKIGEILATKTWLENKNGVESIRYVSKDVAAEKFIAESGENFVRFLGENPLRDAYILHIRNDMANSTNMRQIKDDLEQIPGVFEVEYIESLVSEVNNNISRIGVFLLSFAGILLLTVAVLINNAIKIALFSQRMLIRSMQLVGAEPWFILRPFILRASWQGALSGVLASLLLMTLIQYGYANIPELRVLQNNQSIAIMLFSIIALGCLICSTSTWFVVNRYLKLTLDKLH